MTNNPTHTPYHPTTLPSQAHGLVHHMNPACRAARHFPRLPGARLLLSLNDFDLLAREDYGLAEEDSWGRAMIVRLLSLLCVFLVCVLPTLLPLLRPPLLTPLSLPLSLFPSTQKLRMATAALFGFFLLPSSLRLTDSLAQAYTTLALHLFFIVLYTGSGSDPIVLLGVMALLLAIIPALSVLAAHAAEELAIEMTAKQAADSEEEAKNHSTSAAPGTAAAAAAAAAGGKKGTSMSATGKLHYDGMRDDYYVEPVSGPPMMSPLKPVRHVDDPALGAPAGATAAAVGIMYAGSLTDARTQVLLNRTPQP